MFVLIISDIHANLTALEAVLQDAGEFDAVWFLGDLVGYGPDPNECVDRLRSLPNLTALVGNHDAAALDQIDLNTFNAEARRAVLWTQENTYQEHLEYLNDLPPKVQVNDEVTLVHGSPRQPVWEYVLNTQIATENFDFFETPYCFVGHSHLPVIFQLSDGASRADLFIPEERQRVKLKPRMILNPGSVGQPRDRDPRASYLFLDYERKEVEYRRVAYNIAAVQARMRDAGLPEHHIDRLNVGW
jgi:predicted phosphodiesterase